MSKKLSFKIIFAVFSLLLSVIMLPYFLFLGSPRIYFRLKSKKLNKRNIKEMLEKGKKYFGIKNKNIEVNFSLISGSSYDKINKKYKVKILIFSKRYLTLIHELYHIYRGDCDNHKETLLFAIKLAFMYIFIYEVRTMWYEIKNWKKFI